MNKEKNMKKSAFTLADVLITLAIIGVVAAITIPTMISGFRNKVLKVHFDKCEARAKEIEHAVANEMGVNNFKDLNNLAYNNTDFENLVDAAWHNAIMENYHVDTGFISDNRHYLRDKVSLYNYRGVRMNISACYIKNKSLCSKHMVITFVIRYIRRA